MEGFPAVLVTDPRQFEKTTFLRHEARENMDYVSFDDPLERDFATIAPSGFLDRFAERPVILDEIQYVPTLLPYLKLRIDAEPGRYGHWLLTGSQQFNLMRDIGETAKAFMARGRKPEIFYWRSHDGLEVDLLIVIDGKLQPVEIKLTGTPSVGHVETLGRFIAAAGDEATKQGILVCRTETRQALPHGHLALPWRDFPSWLGIRLDGGH